MPEAPKEADGSPRYVVEPVSVEAVRPLRREHLRPDQAAEAVEYKTDEHETAQHFAVRATDGSDEIIGIGSLCFEDRVAGKPPFPSPGMRIRGLAVAREWRGKGVGIALVAHLLDVGRAAGILEAWGNVPARNLPYLKKCGFKSYSSEFEVRGLGVHIMMVRAL